MNANTDKTGLLQHEGNRTIIKAYGISYIINGAEVQEVIHDASINTSLVLHDRDIDKLLGALERTNLSGGLKFHLRGDKVEFEKTQEALPHIEQIPGPILTGLPCSPGIVEGTSILIGDGDLKGKIIFARNIDSKDRLVDVSGIILEKGNLLSHAAIMARELNIPCVIGVKDATKKLRSGTRLRLDGGQGTITVL